MGISDRIGITLLLYVCAHAHNRTSGWVSDWATMTANHTAAQLWIVAAGLL